MSKNGTVKDCFAKITDSVPEKVVDELTGILNKNLVGTPLENLSIALNAVIKKELSAFSFILGQICESIKYELSKDVKKISSNVESILDLPEFSDIEKVKKFMNILSTKDVIDKTLQNTIDNELGIVIGSESKEVMLKDYSIISLNIETEERKIGKLSVVSPKRLDYSKTISTLKYINNKFKTLITNNDKDKKGG